MKEIKLASGTYLLANCYEANRFEMYGGFVSCYNHSKWVTNIQLPKGGQWSIIGKADELNIQIKMKFLINKEIGGIIGWGFGEEPRYYYPNALEAFDGLIASHNMKPSECLILKLN